MEMACDFCGKLFKDGDDIQAKVRSKFRALKSLRTYAMDMPTDCLAMQHIDCYNNGKDGD